MEAEEVAHTSRLLKFWRLLVSAQSIDFLCSAYQKNQTNQARITTEQNIGSAFFSKFFLRHVMPPLLVHTTLRNAILVFYRYVVSIYLGHQG